MDMTELLRLLGLRQAYDAYQRNVGQPVANVAGPFGRGFLGLQQPEYGSEEAYRTGQAVGNMPGPNVPAGAIKMAAQVPGLLESLPALGMAYRVSTPSKIDPIVGTRFSTENVPGIVPRKPVNWDELLGGSIMTYPTDMLSRNVKVTNVSDIPLGENAFVTPGGLMYMMDAQNIANQIGYASNKGAATSQNNRALRAIEENLAQGGTGRVFMAPHTMPRGGEDFSTGPTLGLLSLIKATNPDKKILDEITEKVRNATVKGKKGKYKDFVGLDDPMVELQLMTGEGLASGSAGDLRKVFVDKASGVAAEKGIGFNYLDLQNAMLDKNVMNKPSFLMGDSIYEALPKLGTRPGTHPAYGYDMPGVFVGNTSGAPISEFMEPVYQRILPTQMGKPGPRQGEFADANQLTRGSLSTAGEGISMFLDEKQIKRLKRLLGQE